MPELGFLSLFIPLTTSLSNVIAPRKAKYVPEKGDVVGSRVAQLNFHVPVNELLLPILPGPSAQPRLLPLPAMMRSRVVRMKSLSENTQSRNQQLK
jgi:hypothetical protein